MTQFKPLLAATVKDFESLTFPLFASPKYDGIRALVRGGVLVSRNLKPIPNRRVSKNLQDPRYEGLDGELIFGPPTGNDVFQRTSSAVMSQDGPPDIHFYVFDRHDLPGHDFLMRQRTLWKTRALELGRIRFVPQVAIDNVAQLVRYEQDRLTEGYEGIMVRSPNGLYKYGRSTLRDGILAKVKRFTDGEARIYGYVERVHNSNEATTDNLGRTKRSSHKAGKVAMDTLGALMVEDIVTGVQFEVGTGFDDALRAAIWADTKGYAGKIIKYKSFQIGVKDKPRFPVFQGFRHEIDL